MELMKPEKVRIELTLYMACQATVHTEPICAELSSQSINMGLLLTILSMWIAPLLIVLHAHYISNIFKADIIGSK